MEDYEPLRLSVLTIGATDPISESSEHDNAGGNFGNLPTAPGNYGK